MQNNPFALEFFSLDHLYPFLYLKLGILLHVKFSDLVYTLH